MTKVRTMKGLIGLMLCAVLLCQGAAASTLFYEGNVIVDAIRADVDIGQKADVAISYMLVNRGGSREQVSLQPGEGQGSPQTVVLEPGLAKEVLFEYTVDAGVDTMRTLSLDPALLINGKPPATRTGSIAVVLRLPPGVPSLISSNRDFTIGETGNDGRVVYYWSAEDCYPTTITAKWSTLGVNLAVEKAIRPGAITEPDQECTVTITLANRGGAAVQNILLRDTFPTSDFEAVSPEGEFHVMAGNGSEPRLIWEKSIPSLPAGQTLALAYRIRYAGETAQVHDFALQPTAVYVDGSLVAASKRVTVSQLTGATRVPDQPPTPAATTPLSIGVILASLLFSAWRGITRGKR
ncbi:MAG TPA: DUF11 domain-containing protein [Methanoculleus sp.]|nr:DUF11 domain-containing protein [Methanoculleus sp.]